MEPKRDITKYFSEDNSANVSSQFLDKVTTVDLSLDSLRNSDKSIETNNVKPNDNSDEPEICRIFQSSNGKRAPEFDPGNFFDMIGTVDNELSHTGMQPNLNVPSHPSGLKETGDVLTFFSTLKTYDEKFPKPAQIVESERSRDAWIIPDSAKEILQEMVSSPQESYLPKRDVDILTRPRIILEEPLKDRIYETVLHYLGENEAAKRKVLTTSEVTEDERGLRDLIQVGCYRAAVNLTKTLLTVYGQGTGRPGDPTKNTVRSIQLWFTRLALLIKLRSFELANGEAEAFGELEKPDMFFQFYPKLYSNRTGSIAPFSLRLLIAQMPAYINQHHLALSRLHRVLTTVRKILSNLDKGLLEDGTPGEISAQDRQESIKLWTNRETRVLHAIVSCALSYKDYTLAIEVVQGLIDREKNPEQQKCLQSALGRILLQLGDITSAEKMFALSREGLTALGGRELLDKGLHLLAEYKIVEAYKSFEKAYELDQRNITALNNMSVCLLYLGKLKEAVRLLQEAIQKYPKIALHESLLLNLCTLYDLQSSYNLQAKFKLLMLVNQNKGDGFNIGCLKLERQLNLVRK